MKCLCWFDFNTFAINGQRHRVSRESRIVTAIHAYLFLLRYLVCWLRFAPSVRLGSVLFRCFLFPNSYFWIILLMKKTMFFASIHASHSFVIFSMRHTIYLQLVNFSVEKHSSYNHIQMLSAMHTNKNEMKQNKSASLFRTSLPPFCTSLFIQKSKRYQLV